MFLSIYDVDENVWVILFYKYEQGKAVDENINPSSFCIVGWRNYFRTQFLKFDEFTDISVSITLQKSSVDASYPLTFFFLGGNLNCGLH